MATAHGRFSGRAKIRPRRLNNRVKVLSERGKNRWQMLVLDENYVQMTVDFTENAVNSCVTTSFSKKRRRRKMWVRPSINQGLPEGQFHN